MLYSTENRGSLFSDIKPYAFTLFVGVAVAGATSIGIYSKASGADVLLSPSICTSPIENLKAENLHDGFSELHHGHRHGAIDLMAPYRTEVRAIAPGHVRKLFQSKQGGRTVYEFDETGSFLYYYAHLDSYAPNLRESSHVACGDIIGYVGTSGNAKPDAPHLHLAIEQLPASKHWWQGTIDPYPVLMTYIDGTRR